MAHCCYRMLKCMCAVLPRELNPILMRLLRRGTGGGGDVGALAARPDDPHLRAPHVGRLATYVRVRKVTIVRIRHMKE